MIHITDHAIDRYIERVAICTRDEARAEMMTAERGIEAAQTIGCRIVRMHNGAKLCLRGGAVVTVMTGGRSCGHFGDDR
jgi:hypothetical protein